MNHDYTSLPNAATVDRSLWPNTGPGSRGGRGIRGARGGRGRGQTSSQISTLLEEVEDSGEDIEKTIISNHSSQI